MTQNSFYPGPAQCRQGQCLIGSVTRTKGHQPSHAGSCSVQERPQDMGPSQKLEHSSYKALLNLPPTLNRARVAPSSSCQLKQPLLTSYIQLYLPNYLLCFRLRERELQLQSDLTTASREINRLRMNIKQAASAGSGSQARAGDQHQLTSASLASLSLRSTPDTDRDRQH